MKSFWKEVLILAKKHCAYLKSTPFLVAASLTGPSIVYAVLGSKLSPSDVKDISHTLSLIMATIVMYTFFAMLPLYSLTLGLVTLEKRSRSFEILRQWGVDERAYWLSVCTVLFPLAVLSGILSAASMKFFLPEFLYPLYHIDLSVLLIIHVLHTWIICATAMVWSSVISKSSNAVLLQVYVVISAILVTTYSLSGPLFATTSNSNPIFAGTALLSYFVRSKGPIGKAIGFLFNPIGGFLEDWARICMVTVVKPTRFTISDLFTVPSSIFGAESVKAWNDRVKIPYLEAYFPTNDLNLEDLESMGSLMSNIVFSLIYLIICVVLSWYLNQTSLGLSAYSRKYSFPFTRKKALTKSEERVLVSFDELSKIYDHRGPALDKVTHEMVKGNVYCILGHNGAGKSTLFKILTGLVKPTNGTGNVCGFDLSNLKDALPWMGICNQEDMLILTYTPYQHFDLYCTVHGVDLSLHGGLEAYTKARLSEVGLEDVMHKKAGEFSGGMKRRLSFILSVLGDSQVIFLDEPSTGLDPLSQAKIWKVVQRVKQNSVVILTTHNMEEAELLSDEVLVMVKGKICANGSSLHLKNTFGGGYEIKLKPLQHLKHRISSSQLSQWALGQIPESFAVSASNGAATIGFPRSVMPELSPFISMIEKEGMLSWSIECSSLEQVFLKVTGSIESEPSLSYSSQDQITTLRAFLDAGTEGFVQKEDLAVTGDFQWCKMTPWLAFKSQMVKYGSQVYRDLIANGIYIFIVILTLYALIQMEERIPITGLLFLLFLKLPRIANLVGSEVHDNLKALQERQNVSKLSYWTALYTASFLLSTAFSIVSLAVTLVFSSGLGWWIFIVVPVSAHATVCTAFFVAAFFKSAIFNGLVIAYLPSALLPDHPLSSLFPMKGIFQAAKSWIATDGNPFLHLSFSFVGSIVFGLMGICWIESSYIKTKFGKSHQIPQEKGTSQELRKDAVNVMVEKQDPRVEQEAQEVHRLDATGNFAENESLRIVDLKKSYGTKNAVNGISLRLLKGETFSMLGPNGAGKTTTLKIIYGDETQTSGKVDVVGMKNERHFGICPQFDTFWDHLSVEEHLKLLGYHYGVPEEKLQAWAISVASLTLLNEDIRRKFPFQLSGGMRRRLSLAMSLISNPKILVLDEPTTGLDPHTRREVWKAVDTFQKDPHRTILLTTHSMQEADALSDRIGIVNHGLLVAIGNQAELKAQYGNVFKLSLIMEVEAAPEEMENVIEAHIHEILKRARKELHSRAEILQQSSTARQDVNVREVNVQIGITREEGDAIVSLFSKLDPFCAELGVLEWGFSQTTLDDVFLHVIGENND